jgi:catechol 2,3-dioxygenase-like lactoylglutathione lyase family enzyme
MKVDGLHHVTAITADIDTNLEFYGQLLGLRLVWQGVNADDPDMRHTQRDTLDEAMRHAYSEYDAS